MIRRGRRRILVQSLTNFGALPIRADKRGEIDMKLARTILIALVACGLSPAYAQQAGNAKSAGAAATAPTPQEVDQQIAAMHERMKTMHEQMARIQQSQDPDERRKLLQEHWESMQGAMAMMNGAW